MLLFGLDHLKTIKLLISLDCDYTIHPGEMIWLGQRYMHIFQTRYRKVFFPELVLKVLHNLIMFTLLFEELVEAISSEA